VFYDLAGARSAFAKEGVSRADADKSIADFLGKAQGISLFQARAHYSDSEIADYLAKLPMPAVPTLSATLTPPASNGVPLDCQAPVSH